MLRQAADGVFPAADGGWRRVPPWRVGVEAVLAFTGHAVLAVGDHTDDHALAALDPHGFGGAHHPRVVTALAGPDGWVDSLDVVLVARGRGGPVSLVEREDRRDHPRARYAGRLRDDVRVMSDAADTGLVTLGTGLGGLAEISIEVTRPGRGDARALLTQAVEAAPAGDVVCALVAPGNAASLRSFLAAGFVPVASAQLYVPSP